MWLAGLLIFLKGLSFVNGDSLPSEPACAISCWENTKYVSRCLNDLACLCNDVGYQKSLFQCLYSQCDTAHYSSALHYAISQCSDFGSQMDFGALPVASHDSLRRRMEAEYLAGARGKRQQAGVSAIPFPVESAALPIESAAFLIQSAPLPTPTALFPTQSLDPALGERASPASDFLGPRNVDQLPPTITTVITTSTRSPIFLPEDSMQAVTVPGAARETRPYSFLHVLSTVVVVCFTF